MAVQLVTIEGNIGTGKSTLASHVAKYMPAMKFFAAPEPEHNPHWHAFQATPSDHALALQTWFLRERCRIYMRALRHMEEKRESVILDFSIWSDPIFAIKHHEDGYMTAEQYESYQELVDRIFSLNLPPPHLSIVLQATPAVCLDRCGLSPARKACKPQINHLKRLDELYDQRWLRDLDKAYKIRWLHDQRGGSARPPQVEGGMPAAPSLLILVRDWTDLTTVKASAIADAVMSTSPTKLDQWLAAYNEKELLRVLAMSDEQCPSPASVKDGN